MIYHCIMLFVFYQRWQCTEAHSVLPSLSGDLFFIDLGLKFSKHFVANRSFLLILKWLQLEAIIAKFNKIKI